MKLDPKSMCAGAGLLAASLGPRNADSVYRGLSTGASRFTARSTATTREPALLQASMHGRTRMPYRRFPGNQR